MSGQKEAPRTSRISGTLCCHSHEEQDPLTWVSVPITIRVCVGVAVAQEVEEVGALIPGCSSVHG